MAGSDYTLELKAGADAFGDGSHPSTQGAMVALEALSGFAGLEKALDIGCGSGVLALQIAYLWHVPVIASDINPLAVQAAQANAEHNRLAPLITALCADGYRHEKIRAGAPYDLITCNWLAEQLHAHAHDLSAHLADEGIAILSGILTAHADSVIEAHRACGLTLLQHIKVEGWSTLLMQKEEA